MDNMQKQAFFKDYSIVHITSYEEFMMGTVVYEQPI